MTRSPIITGLFGFTGGFLIVVLALACEMFEQDLFMKGGLLALQLNSVVVWVLESLPLVMGFSAFLLASHAAAREKPVPWARPIPAPPVSVATIAPPPVPEGLGKSAVPLVEQKGGAPPIPTELQGLGGLDNRVKPLQELVKVLKEQSERTASESRAKSAYLANMSHELRTPLSAIVGYAELLLEEAEDQRLDLAEDLKKVSGAGRQLVELINNILDLSKIEVGQLSVVLEDVDLAQVVDEARVSVAPLLANNVNMFSARVSPGARLVRGDHMRLRQIVVNLLSNALKFTKKGQVQLVVERATPKRDAWIAIRVRDTGIGMTPEEVERAFDEYAQTEDRVTSSGRGTGLGLAISRKLAELMGGRIEVESEKGSGSTFTVILPPARMSEDAIPPRSAVALNERLAGTRLVVVDPDAFGISIARYLERAGLEVKLVTDTKSARIAGDAENPQMVIIDVGLPDAWTLVEDLVVDGAKVVATSIRDEDVEIALQLGVTAFLVRPLERKLVLATLERCLDGTPTIGNNRR